MYYDLSHLTGPDNQVVCGPIQDDEALLLYAMVKTMRLRRILEIGGLDGYSATNFLAATEGLANSTIYTVDIHDVKPIGTRHKCIIKNALLLSAEDLENKPLDLIFFDCHDYIQFDLYKNLLQLGIVNDDTVLVLHDTNTYPTNFFGSHKATPQGYLHQPVEREMTNWFRNNWGYNIINFHTKMEDHDSTLPIRHRLTICQKSKLLIV